MLYYLQCFYPVFYIIDKKQLLIRLLKEKYKVQYDAIKPIPYIKERLYCVDKI